jgi:hypothetical protein
MDAEMNQMLKELDEKKLIHLSSAMIKDAKNNILQKMGFNRTELKNYHRVLKEYRFIDELDELALGHHIRWFNLTQPDKIKLHNGAILTKIEFKNNQIVLLCKGYRGGFFNLHMNNLILFQKFTAQEKLLIHILDYIQEK